MSVSGWLSGLFAPRAPITDSDWSALLGRSRLFARLDTRERERLRELAARFLAKKSFTAAAGHVLSDGQRHAIAALACLPVLHLGFEWLAGWHACCCRAVPAGVGALLMRALPIPRHRPGAIR